MRPSKCLPQCFTLKKKNSRYNTKKKKKLLHLQFAQELASNIAKEFVKDFAQTLSDMKKVLRELADENEYVCKQSMHLLSQGPSQASRSYEEI